MKKTTLNTQIDSLVESFTAQRLVTCAICLAFELFYCEGQLLQNEEEDDEDSDHGQISKAQETVTSKAVNMSEQNIILPAATKAIPAPIMLADLCENNSHLQKDVVFLYRTWKIVIGC